MFGPVEFEGLNLLEGESPFDYAEQREKVTSTLERSLYMPINLCIHGYKVTVKQRQLKRRGSLLKHARFLKNLEVFPNFPPPKEPTKEEDEGSGQEEWI